MLNITRHFREKESQNLKGSVMLAIVVFVGISVLFITFVSPSVGGANGAPVITEQSLNPTPLMNAKGTALSPHQFSTPYQFSENY